MEKEQIVLFLTYRLQCFRNLVELQVSKGVVNIRRSSRHFDWVEVEGTEQD